MAITVLVTDGEQRSALAATRSLGRYGCRVVVIGNDQKNLASSSRYCEVRYAVKSYNDNRLKFFDHIASIAKKENVDYIYPMTEPAMMILSENNAALPPSTFVAAPDIDKLKTVFNKNVVFKLAQQAGVPIPKTIFIDGKEDFEQKAMQVVNYPVVVKPSMSKFPTADGRFIEGGVMYANNQETLSRLYSSNKILSCPSMIQEKIIGPGTGLFTLFDKNRHLALFSHKRLREKPPSGGVSVLCESVPLDTEMVESAKKLLTSVGWQGVAMVEFKRDLRDGKAKLMEINGRFWGSLQLAISAGIDFPVLLLKYLQGEKILKTETKYKTGLKLKWLLGTLDYLIIRLKNKNSVLNLPPEYPSKLQSIIEFLKIRDSNTVFDVLDVRDMRPFICELQQYITNF